MYPIALAVIPILAAGLNPLAGGGPSESEVKSAYVLNILRLTQRKDSAGTELHLCLVRPGVLEPALQALDGTLIQGRRLKTRTAQKEQIDGCDVLFFGELSGAAKTLSRGHAMGMLTIGCDEKFLGMSGMVSLVMEHRRIVVEINQAALRSPAWTFSSHLLEVARVIQGGLP
ncbi:MAG: YfiR family protein [Acidobacteria bacterium]|nr:YfiR family protein [Acidobacteriota bacterium]